MKKTKIIATLGPSSDDPKIMEKLIDAGANVFRINFSHATEEEKENRIKYLREIEKRRKIPVAILQDLQGPKIRVGILPSEGVQLKVGKEITLTVDEPKDGEVPVQYKGIVGDVSAGDRVLLADGKMELKVLSKTAKNIKCKVVTGGVLTSKKGINLPTSSISLPALSEKDKRDVAYGLKNDVDYIALSFVKSEDDIKDLRKIITQAGKKTKIIAKIERHEAIANIDEIIEASDAIMVARGDLGIEVSLADVPLHQKDIIKKCNSCGKPVIVATQMLDSMIRNPISTRAETSDIANAILDGADAVMLSDETAVGKYPVNAVKAMRKIALHAERWSNDTHKIIGEDAIKSINSTSEAIGKSACKLAAELKAKVIINATARGKTTRNVARFRPHCHIISVTHTLKTARELELVWGVIPFVLNYKTVREMSLKSTEIAKSLGLVKKGDKIIIVSGEEVGVEGGTNIIKVKEL
ncbi:MAG: pyruvate kinase [bacterium]|nr:pyruvate kinase [bacterium]